MEKLSVTPRRETIAVCIKEYTEPAGYKHTTHTFKVGEQISIVPRSEREDFYSIYPNCILTRGMILNLTQPECWEFYQCGWEPIESFEFT